jgi:hypothetical protein
MAVLHREKTRYDYVMSDAKQSLIPIMTGQYSRLVEIETDWQIRLHEGDQRPRIEYFHDAVRALTSGQGDPYGKHSRLSVEHLAYDIDQLRRAQSQPMGLRNNANQASPHSDVVPTGGLAQSRARGPDRAIRAEISQLYKDYTVLFAALFAEIADMNFKSRIEEADQSVEDIALAEDVLNKLADGKISAQQAQAMLDGIEQDALREKIQLAIQSRTIRHTEAEALIANLNGLEGQIENEKMVIEKAHLTYVTGQLAVYEESTDTVKRLAAQGLNLAGKFVESAIANSAGRGAGMGV